MVTIKQINSPSPLSKALDWLLPSSLRDVLRAAAEFLRVAGTLLRHLKRTHGLYEVLSYRASLTLVDAQGQRAIYQKRERLRFLRDGVTSFYDYAWGPGEAFASHRVRPGRVVESRQIGSRRRSLVVLPASQKKGDELTFEVRRLIRDGIVGHRNWLEAEVNHPMRRLELSVILPASRPVRSARLIRRGVQGETPLTVRTTAAGKQQISSSMKKPRIGDLYTLEWTW